MLNHAHRPRFRSVAALALGLITLASAQAQPLPDDLPRAQSLSAAQVQQVQAFVRRNADALKGGDSAKVQEARNALLAPLESGNVSVAFRLAMSEALAPELAEIARRPDEHLAFNALRLSGALATDAAVDIIRRALSDKRVSVRYGATLGARLTIEAVDAKRSPLPQNQLDALLAALKDALRAETDPEVFGGLVAALNAVDKQRQGAANTQALSDLSQIVGQRLAKEDASEPEPGWARAYQRAIGAAQEAVAKQLAGGSLDRAFARSVATASGQALAYTARRLNAEGELSETERPAIRDLVASAEFALIFIDNSIGQRQQNNRLLLDAFEASASQGPKRFLDEAAKWVGPQGLLTKDPYERTTFNTGR